MAASGIGLLGDEFAELELAPQTQRVRRYATYYGAISWDIGQGSRVSRSARIATGGLVASGERGSA